MLLAAARVAAFGAACLMLAHAGAIAWPHLPWTAIALPGGLALLAGHRAGPVLALGAATGVGLALLTLQHAHAVAAAGALTVAAIAWPGAIALRRLEFDSRLARTRDLGALVGVIVVATLPPAAALAGLLAMNGTAPFWPQAAAGWLVLALGALLAALAALSVEQRLRSDSAHAPRWQETTLAVAGMLAALGLLWAAGDAGAATRAAAAFALPLVVAALALRGHLMVAALGLLSAVLLAGLVVHSADAPLAQGGAAASWLLAWVACGVTAVAGGHAFATDRTERLRRWEWALDGTRLGVADWSLATGPGFASGMWRTMVGHQGLGWPQAQWLARVHPDDRARLEATLDAVASGRSGRQSLRLRMPLAEGWRWYEATLLAMDRDPADRPTRLLATLADVNDWHELQERELMSVSLFQHLHEGLLVTDADLRALDVNPAYTQILGVTREETLGQVPSLLRPDPADPLARRQRAAMWTSLRNEGSWRGELLERRRGGAACTLQTTISTVHGADGDLRYHVVVIADITEQRLQRERLEQRAHFDELTRLPNRARLSQLLVEAMAAADRDGFLLVVCYLDLDHFKPVNDRYGHAAGDRLLAELAGRLRGALRSRESWADAAARLGGDEFVLLLRVGTVEEARLAVERVLRVVAQPYLIDPAHPAVPVSASMGATIYPIDRSDADALLRHADHAMYGAKQAGRNGYLFFDPEHRRRTEERVMAIGRVQEALDLQEFVLFYQPKVDMRSGRVLGLEALLRWDHPQQGLIAPMQFLPLIENTGLSSSIGDWVIGQALAHLAQWRHSGLDITVSVNVSARHLQEPDFALRLSELLARQEEPLAPYLELEMLETAAHADIEATSELMARCRSLGVRFALDDFGTGYSTLTYLKRLPVDVLKIDRSFVHHMLDDTQDRAIVEGVIGLARTFGCTAVAEGVESPAQARTLLEMGCDVGQGTGIAAPMRVDLVAQWVRDYRGMFALQPAESARPASA